MNMIKSHGAPTPLTVGQLGQRYLDLDTDKKYVCVDIQRGERIDDGPSIHDGFVHTKEFVVNGNFYVWEELAGSASGEHDWDVIIYGDNHVMGGTSMSVTDWTLKKGDYTTLVNKILAGEPVHALVHVEETTGVKTVSVETIEWARYLRDYEAVAFITQEHGDLFLRSDNTLSEEFN